MKNNDIYRFSPKNPEPYWNWCFDGYLVYNNGKLYDTYWGIFPRNSEGKVFTEKTLTEIGTIEYYFNLDDVVEVKEYQTLYYRKEDQRYLPEQHSCYPHYYLLKEAKRHKETILVSIDAKIAAITSEIKYLNSNLESLKQSRDKVEKENNFNIYI